MKIKISISWVLLFNLMVLGCSDLANEPLSEVPLIPDQTYTDLTVKGGTTATLSMDLKADQMVQIRVWSLAKLVGVDAVLKGPNDREIWRGKSPGTELQIDAVRVAFDGKHTLQVTWAEGSGIANYRFGVLSADPSPLATPKAFDLNVPRFGHQATLLADGTVLVTGGVVLDGEDQATDSAEIVSPEEGRTTSASALKVKRAFHSAQLIEADEQLASGRVFLAGGLSASGDALSSTEIFDPASGASVVGPYLPEPRAFMASLYIPGIEGKESYLDGKIVVVGGENTRRGPQFDRIEYRYSEIDENGKEMFYFDPITASSDQALEAIPVKMSLGRLQPTLSFLPNGWILILGGGVDSIPSAPGCVDGETDESGGRCHCQSAEVPLCTQFFGEGADATYVNFTRKDRATNIAEVYDITSGELFTLENKMQRARVGHSTAVLADGRVIIVGGSTAHRRHFNPTEAGLPEYPQTIESLEIFDPTEVDDEGRQGVFRLLPPLAVPREQHRSILMADGTVLIAGGARSAPGGLVAVQVIERFDLLKGRSEVIDFLIEPRMDATVTLLADGMSVLVAGGSNQGLPLSTAELLRLKADEK